MGESEDITRVIRALKKVPEKHLLIVELANQVLNEKGELDADTLADRQPEINLAVAEAKAYGRATIRAVDTLKKLEARATDVGPGYPALPE